MDRQTGTSSTPPYAEPESTPEHKLAEVENLLKRGRIKQRFPQPLEAKFSSDMSSARIADFTRIGWFGLFLYNAFLFINWYILTDIIVKVAFVQLVLISPILALSLILIHKKVVLPEITVTLNLMVVIGTVIIFYSQSRAPLAGYYIFTIPVCLAFGNILLPLPFRLSAWFTGFCVAASSAAVLTRPGQETALTWFAIVVNANSGAYMLIATFRMEASERQAYLVHLREKLRAEILLDAWCASPCSGPRPAGGRARISR